MLANEVLESRVATSAGAAETYKFASIWSLARYSFSVMLCRAIVCELAVQF